jgi:uncharacterized protein (DUF2062 family)
MFRRRSPPSLSRRLRNLVWPTMGLRRTTHYFWRRLQRIPASPPEVASGFAIGVAMAMSPIVGTHMITAMALSWFLGANLLAAVIGTLVINPWTAPPVWFATYYVGRLMEGLPVLGRANEPPFISMFKALTESALQLDGALFARHVWPVLKPMLLGSIPLGLVTGFAIYAVLLPLLNAMHARRAHRRSQHARHHHHPHAAP